VTILLIYKLKNFRKKCFNLKLKLVFIRFISFLGI
jgi:hypothetical protein